VVLAQSRASRVLLCVGLLTAIIAASAVTGAASEDEEPIRLTFQARPGCPAETEFVTRIRARTTRARVAWPGENARTFDVILEAGPPPSGRVIILDADIPVGTRRVEADTCADVADALALVIALSIDPHASSPPAAPAPDHDPVERGPTVRATPVNDERSREIQPPTGRPLASMLAGADFAVTYGVAPSALMSASPYIGWRSNASGLFDPSVRLSFVYGASDTGPAATGSADFTWTVGRLDVCPSNWIRSSVRLTTCARIESGVLAVAAHAVAAPETRMRPWLAAGVLARAEWSFLRPVFLDADIDLLLRTTNDRFYFLPDTTVYRVPVLGAGGGVGLGAHFL
jgi:hypothetical protein